MKTLLALVTCLSVTWTAPASGQNAFADPASAEEAFYLRVGIGLDHPAETRFMDKDCSSVPPAALCGCGSGTDGAPLRALGDFGTLAGLELGLGYAGVSTVRFEVLIDYRPRIAFEGRANFLEPTRRQSVSADLSSVSGMLAAYVDLPELGLPRLGPVSPFIGGGIGAARTEIGDTRMMFPRTTTLVPGTSRGTLVWMLTAGGATALGANLTLDLAWRYTDLGTAETGRGEGRIVWRDGSRAPLLLNLAATRAALKSHGVQLSLRYAL